MDFRIFVLFAVLFTLTVIVYQACKKISSICSRSSFKENQFDGMVRIFESGRNGVVERRAHFDACAAEHGLAGEARKQLWAPVHAYLFDAANALMRRDYHQLAIQLVKAQKEADRVIDDLTKSPK